MKILVGVTSYAAAWVMPRVWVERLRRDFPHHDFVDAWDDAGIRRLVPEAEVAFIPYLSRDMLASATRLRWIQVPAVGVGHMLSPEMIASPIVLTTARGLRARAIAEHVIGVALALARQLHVAVRRQIERRWAQDELEGATTAIRSLAGATMGIVGFGSIGQEVARMAAAIDMRVIATKRRVDPAPAGVARVLPPDRLDELLAESDVVVLCVPVTPDTRALINRDTLARMKRSAFLVNIGRGRLVDDEALVEALQRGTIAGAALDVFTREPLAASSPYWDLPNVIVTPHTSGAMEDYWTPLVGLFAENLRRFESGQPLLNLVDKTAGY